MIIRAKKRSTIGTKMTLVVTKISSSKLERYYGSNRRTSIFLIKD